MTIKQNTVGEAFRALPLLVAILLAALACTPGSRDDRAVEQTGNVRLEGSGASFPAPLYRRWIEGFRTAQPGVEIEFKSKGSGAGIRDFIAGETDFGASDAAMTDEHLIAQGNQALMLPVTAGAIVLGYNLPGVSSLRLSRSVYTAIFLGRIQHWDDPDILALNPGKPIPSIRIHVVYRSDPSGTTFVFLNHLDKASPWQETLGVGLDAHWPIGSGAEGNSGVAAAVGRTPGAIGYLQLMSARSQGLAVATLENRDGKFVDPTLEASRQTLLAVGLPDDLRAWIPDPVGPESYPIVTYTWLLVNKTYEVAKAEALKRFLRYALTEGQQLSEEMHYVSLPAAVSTRVRETAEEITPTKRH